MTIPIPFGRRLVLSARLVRSPRPTMPHTFGAEWDDRALVHLAAMHNAGISPPWERAIVLLKGERWPI